jgi:hypothetical protein
LGAPLTEDTVEAMLTIEAPAPRSSILGKKARIVMNIERTLSANDASHSIGSASRIVP